MKIFAIAMLIAVAVAEEASSQYYFSDEYIQEVNALATTWTAGRNFPENTSLSELQCLMGSLISDKEELEIKEDDFSIMEADIPETFDAREKWPICTGIRVIQDQSKCGSCWAVAAASSISDRICVQSKGAQQPTISALDIMTCCATDCAKGCKGGKQSKAWKHWVDHGVVTGGVYGSGVGCKPYPYPPCGRGVKGTRYGNCPSVRYTPPACSRKCDNASLVYDKELHKGASSFRTSGISVMQKELMTHGPLEISFEVFSDFSHYKSGVYQKTATAKFVGRHSVRLLGWGVEKHTPYWLIANSWNVEWGDKGTFKILRGQNHCDVEKEVVGGLIHL